MPRKKKEKEAKIFNTKQYVKDDIQITETVKVIDTDTDFLTTPWGTKVKATDIVKVLDEYYSLSKEEREKEKQIWVDLISKMMGEREDGLKVVDIELSLDGSKGIKFIYR